MKRTTDARGAALLDAVIGKLARGKHMATGKLALPDGRPLPPSLARVLAHDPHYLPVLEGKPPRLAFRSFYEMMLQQFDERTADLYRFGDLLPGQCLVVSRTPSSLRFMYAGDPDRFGEYPVFVVDTEELPSLSLAYPGLDAYLAERVGLVHGAYAPMLVEQAGRNFHGFLSMDLDDA
jgi:hypothetical protein